MCPSLKSENCKYTYRGRSRGVHFGEKVKDKKKK